MKKLLGYILCFAPVTILIVLMHYAIYMQYGVVPMAIILAIEIVFIAMILIGTKMITEGNKKK